MSKSKKSKKKQRTPNLSPLSVLRPRLDSLWGRTGSTEQSEAQIMADLNQLTAKIQAQDFLPILLRAYGEAPNSIRTSLDEALPMWLQEQQHMDALSQMITRAELQAEDQQIASSWLEQGGVDVEQLLQKRPSLFYKAYLLEDFDDTADSFIWIFSYTNRRRNKVHGFSLYADSDAPWEGSISQAQYHPTRTPEEIHSDYMDFWERQLGTEIDEVDPEEVKQYICHALHQNIGQNIRPEKELIDNRKAFMQIMAQLPDSDDEIALMFTETNFDELMSLTRRAEEVQEATKRMYEELEKKHHDSASTSDENDDWDEEDWDDEKDWDEEEDWDEDEIKN